VLIRIQIALVVLASVAGAVLLAGAPWD
jgi:hypothetical protein